MLAGVGSGGEWGDKGRGRGEADSPRLDLPTQKL